MRSSGSMPAAPQGHFHIDAMTLDLLQGRARRNHVSTTAPEACGVLSSTAGARQQRACIIMLLAVSRRCVAAVPSQIVGVAVAHLPIPDGERRKVHDAVAKGLELG